MKNLLFTIAKVLGFLVLVRVLQTLVEMIMYMAGGALSFLGYYVSVAGETGLPTVL